MDTNGNIIAIYDTEVASTTAMNMFSDVHLASSVNSSCTSWRDVDLTKVIRPKNGYVNVMDENGKWGMMNLNTKTMLIDYSYDYIGAYSDNAIAVCNSGKWRLIDSAGKELIPCNSFNYIGDFVNDKAFAINDTGTICVINKKGEVIGTYDVDVSVSNLTSARKVFEYINFNEANQTAIIASYQRLYIVSDSGEILEKIILSDDLSESLYMNNDYIVVNGHSRTFVFKVNY